MNEYVLPTLIISGPSGTPNVCCLAVSLTSHRSVVSNLWGLGTQLGILHAQFAPAQKSPVHKDDVALMPPALFHACYAMQERGMHFVEDNRWSFYTRCSDIDLSYYSSAVLAESIY